MEHGSRGPFDLFTNVTQLELETKQCGEAAADGTALATAQHTVKRHDVNGGVAAAWSGGGGGGRRGGKDHWVQKVGGNYPTSPLTMRVRPFIMIMIA